jgi:hypothetical protein|tara:strand:+ start:1614 stop:1964 length:351 start_codon:yes stop_codon:yes gene_type:complete
LTLTLHNNFETRIRVLSKSLRQTINTTELIDEIKQAYNQSELIGDDGYPDLESLEFELETEDFLIHGSNGPITWVGIFLAWKYPKKRIRVSWLDLDWKREKIHFMVQNNKLTKQDS